MPPLHVQPRALKAQAAATSPTPPSPTTTATRTHRRPPPQQEPQPCIPAQVASLDRRRLGLAAGAGLLVALADAPRPPRAQAALPFALPEGLFPSPPEPIFFPRKTLDQSFAVLLMRSGFEAVDDLDFIAMDQFQVAFWKLRQAEQEGYKLQYEPNLRVRTGDLTDPLYFDFISHAQWAVINREMPRGKQVFEEFCEDCGRGGTGGAGGAGAGRAGGGGGTASLPAAVTLQQPPVVQLAASNTLSTPPPPPATATLAALEAAAPEQDAPTFRWQTRVVRRDGRLADNALLPQALCERVGDKVYLGLKDGFRGQVFGAPAPLPPSASPQQVLAAVKQLLDVMVGRGYALKCEVVEVKAGPPLSFKVRTTGPANLWGMSDLAFRRSAALPSYDALVVAAFLRASGRALALPSPRAAQPATRVLPDAGTETSFVLMA